MVWRNKEGEDKEKLCCMCFEKARDTNDEGSPVCTMHKNKKEKKVTFGGVEWIESRDCNMCDSPRPSVAGQTLCQMHINESAVANVKKSNKRSSESGTISQDSGKKLKVAAAVEKEDANLLSSSDSDSDDDSVVGPSQPMPYEIEIDLPGDKTMKMLVDKTTSMADVMRRVFYEYDDDDLSFSCYPHKDMELEPERTMGSFNIEEDEEEGFTTTIYTEILPRGGRSYIIRASVEDCTRCQGCFDFYNCVEHHSQTCSRMCTDTLLSRQEVLCYPDRIQEQLEKAQAHRFRLEAEMGTIVPETPPNSEDDEPAGEVERDLKLVQRKEAHLQELLKSARSEAETMEASLAESKKQDNFVGSVQSMTSETITIALNGSELQISRDSGEITGGTLNNRGQHYTYTHITFVDFDFTGVE